jgi:hypothetical protein
MNLFPTEKIADPQRKCGWTSWKGMDCSMMLCTFMNFPIMDDHFRGVFGEIVDEEGEERCSA